MELTRTSANHLANMAKEAYQQEETTLTNISFVSTSIELLDSTCVKVIKKGKTLGDLLKFKDSLTKISKYKYLIAYLRESIKSLDEELSATYIIVQHMPVGFTKNLAERLNSLIIVLKKWLQLL